MPDTHPFKHDPRRKQCREPTVALIAVVSFLAGTVVGVLGYITVFAGSGEASRDIQDVAPTLDLGRALPAGDIMLMSDSTRNFAQPATTEEPDAPADDMSAEATPEATPVPLGEPISFCTRAVSHQPRQQPRQLQHF
jgi:hypothetical protein